MSSNWEVKLARANCQVAVDRLTRQLYATDASIYEIQPAAVAFPRSAAQACSLVEVAGELGLTVTPRGAGTGLVGGALGDGVILDLARHNQSITELNLEQRTVRVGPGVVLDQLNTFLRPQGFCFGPDVATSSRATLGGMIANNSSGARVPVYGTTADHVRSLEILLGDGRIETVGPNRDALRDQRDLARQLVRKYAAEIDHRMPPGLLKRWPGYALDRFRREPDNLVQLLAGSEGTLAGILSAELKIVPLPREKGLALIFFGSVADAMQAAVELLDLKPAAIEHIDRVLFDQTRGQLQFRAARDMLELDAQPCDSILLVEFYDAPAERLYEVERRKLGTRTLLLRGAPEMNLVWNLRKAGLSLLTSRKGPAKPTTCVEDTAVRPEQLPAYVEGLQSIMRPLQVEVCYYGHAAAGLLHVRPVLDLHRAADRQKLRAISDQVAALVRQFNGSLAAEHGVGMARTEYLAGQVGPELMDAMRAIKRSFDPANLLNPGKIIDDGRFLIDTSLRVGSGERAPLPFAPVLAFAEKDGSFLANLEQCNGCGGCRKLAPTMCPTFLATGDEIMSTRGRANAIRAMLNANGTNARDVLFSPELELALSNCLSCKACTTECPSNVNMALLKAELLHARHARRGLTLRERALSSVDMLGWLGCTAPALANRLLRSPALRWLLSRTLGLSGKRQLPEYTRDRFDRWFERHVPSSQTAARGPVILWDDTFVRYYEPQIGIAAVRVLEAAGFEVTVLRGRRCCGRPAFSQGHLDRAARLGRRNLQLLAKASPDGNHAEELRTGGREAAPILFLEPSCYSMFAQEYRELGLPGAAAMAGRCFLFEQFVDDLLSRDPAALQFKEERHRVAVHAHCHAKSLTDTACMARLARRLGGDSSLVLPTGCCGMAGAFGAMESKLDLSLKVAEPLLRQLEQQPAGTRVVASGTSCRQQIEHLTGSRPLHMAELIAERLQSQERELQSG